jgi:hypothetical protein
MERKGVIIGAIWGLIGPILYGILGDLRLPGIKIALQMIALPLIIYSKFIPSSAPGGSFYYSPIIAFPFSIAVGAIIGFGIEKIWRCKHA